LHLRLTQSINLSYFYFVPVIISGISKVDKQPPSPNTTPHTSEKGRNNDKKKISTCSSDETDNLGIREMYRRNKKRQNNRDRR
jgi:hypothetical protein